MPRELVCCAPSRATILHWANAHQRGWERDAYAAFAAGEGMTFTSYFVKGSKGYEVSRRGREIALKAWETRRRRLAERKAAEAAARQVTHPVIKGTLPADAPVVQPTRSLVLR